jgi:hypothetical protein
MRQHFAHCFVDLRRAGLTAESVTKLGLDHPSCDRMTERRRKQKPLVKILLMIAAAVAGTLISYYLLGLSLTLCVVAGGVAGGIVGGVLPSQTARTHPDEIETKTAAQV